MPAELPRNFSDLVAETNQGSLDTVRGDMTFRRHLGRCAAFPPNPAPRPAGS